MRAATVVFIQLGGLVEDEGSTVLVDMAIMPDEVILLEIGMELGFN